VFHYIIYPAYSTCCFPNEWGRWSIRNANRIGDAKINKCRREIADSLIPAEADILMARIMALQGNEEEDKDALLSSSLFILLLQWSKLWNESSSSKIKSSRKRCKIPYGNFAVREHPYYDHDDGGFANYIFNELCSFGPGTVNIFRKMVGLQEATWSKEGNKKDG